MCEGQRMNHSTLCLDVLRAEEPRRFQENIQKQKQHIRYTATLSEDVV